MKSRKNIVVIGGGTGTFTVLSGLKKYPADLTAIVAMADNGGSTGILRDELGVLPPGDVRQCLVALATAGNTLRNLMNYRFAEGGLRGHTFGNIFLSALEKTTGSFDAAVATAAEILRLRGEVVPATLTKVQLVAYFHNKLVIRGQNEISKADLTNLKKIVLEPRATANPKALRAIREADVIVLGPGDFYSSIIPNLIVPGIARAISRSKAKKIYICNLMNRAGQTDGFSVRDYEDVLGAYLGRSLDHIIFNKAIPPQTVLKRYMREGDHPVVPIRSNNPRYIGGNLINKKIARPRKGDIMRRNLIRHNPDLLAELIMERI